MDDFLHHMLRLGNFAWELRNHWLEQLLCEPLSAAAWVHRWLTAAEGSRPPPPPRPGKHFVASFRVVVLAIDGGIFMDLHLLRGSHAVPKPGMVELPDFLQLSQQSLDGPQVGDQRVRCFGC